MCGAIALREDDGVSARHFTGYCKSHDMLRVIHKKMPYFVVSAANRGDLVNAFG